MSKAPVRAFIGWRILLLCFLAQNCAIGLMVGSMGPLLASTEAHLGVSRTMATTAMGMTGLAIGVLAPFLGGMLHRLSIKLAMIAGAIACAAAYWGLAMTSSFVAAAAFFALLGLGVALLGILGPLTLISRWFSRNRATLLSIVNLPIFALLLPLAIGRLLPEYGRTAVLGGIGSTVLLLAVLLLFAVDRPEQLGQSPYGSGDAQSESAASDIQADRRLWSTAEILTCGRFWLLSLGVGLMTGCGGIFVTHATAFATGQGMALQMASGLLSAFAGAGAAGMLFVGRLADRIGAPAALCIACACQAIVWWAMPQLGETHLFIAAGVIGMFTAPLVMLHGAATTAIAGTASVSRMMGMSYAVKLPFMFGLPPLAALLFDTTGSYRLPFLAAGGALALAAALFLMLHWSVRGLAVSGQVAR